MKPALILVTELSTPALPLWPNTPTTAPISCFNPALCRRQENHLPLSSCETLGLTCHALPPQYPARPDCRLFEALLNAVRMEHGKGKRGHSPCRCQDTGGMRGNKEVAEAWNMLWGEAFKDSHHPSVLPVYLHFSLPRRSALVCVALNRLVARSCGCFVFTSLFAFSPFPYH